MIHKTFKPKLLLDENFPIRVYFPILNSRYDVKHISEDLHKDGIKDPEVYELAKQQKRLVVTYNNKDFRPFADMSQESGIIGISQNLTFSQIDTKLAALLKKNSSKNLYGAFHYISGET
jgi:predicted nuclease of predicted toxin-antitoxin system